MSTTLFVDAPELSESMWGPEHPWRPERLALTRTLLEAVDLLDTSSVVAPKRMDERLLHSVHDADYVEAVKAAGRGGEVEDPWRYGLGTSDNPIVPGMDRATLRICDATVTAADLLGDGTATRVASLSGGLHHAHRDRASGFCVFNDLALAIERLTGTYGLRVAYLDIDAHHGDGVQAAFETRTDVMTISLHESGRYLFPGTGFEDEIGRDAGIGTCVNLPLDPGTDDASYLEVFDLLVPAALQSFGPDVLVVQAGADAHRRDPLAHLELSLSGFAALYERVVALADGVTGGRLLVTGGGGYDAYRTVPRAWARLWCALTGQQLPDELPEAWREAWRGRVTEELPRRADDEDPPEPRSHRHDRAASHNRTVAQRALTSLSGVWARSGSGR
jgi:acetoin utilization protein AcuC